MTDDTTYDVELHSIGAEKMAILLDGLSTLALMIYESGGDPGTIKAHDDLLRVMIEQNRDEFRRFVLEHDGVEGMVVSDGAADILDVRVMDDGTVMDMEDHTDIDVG